MPIHSGFFIDTNQKLIIAQSYKFDGGLFKDCMIAQRIKKWFSFIRNPLMIGQSCACCRLGYQRNKCE